MQDDLLRTLDKLGATLERCDPQGPGFLERLEGVLAAISRLSPAPGRGTAEADRFSSAQQALAEAAAGRLDREEALTVVRAALAGVRQLLAAGQPKTAGESAGPAAPASAARRDPDTLELLGDFVLEAEENLLRADAILVAGERAGFDDEAIHELFRLFHSLKGLAGHLPDAAEVARLSHAAEDLLSLARSRQLALEGEPLDLTFEASALLQRSIAGLRQALRSDSPAAPTPGVAQLVDALRSAAGNSSGLSAGPSASPATPAPLGAPEAPARASRQLKDLLRVDSARVDALVEMVGELLIVESMLSHDPAIAALRSARIGNHLAQLSRISRDLQDSAMQLRMVPVRSVFKRMQRLVRELAHRAGKEVCLQLSGDSTEMDRAMVDSLEEPLVHLLRNAIDHGVEHSSERLAAGKPGLATIRLSACHHGGNIVVEVADDGRGLDHQRILEKARSAGLVADGATPSEIDSLIFLPGFSTAQAVTDLSGRGVGMDVVKRRVEGLRGRVLVESTPGRGACFSLVLPLTLAVIDGMLVGVGEERFIVPSLSVVESLHLDAGMLASVAGRGEVLNVRGEVMPVTDLGELFGVAGSAGHSRQLAMVVESLGRKVGLLVDKVLSQQQVVIKPLALGAGRAEMFTGAAILSDGRVGLIVNVDRVCAARARHAGLPERQQQEGA